MNTESTITDALRCVWKLFELSSKYRLQFVYKDRKSCTFTCYTQV